MSVIEKEVELVGTKGRETVLALFDSGATCSCIDPDLAAKMEGILPLASPLSFEAAKEKQVIQVTEPVALDVHVNDDRLWDEVFVSPTVWKKLLVGATRQQKFRLKLGFEHDGVIVDPGITKRRR